MWIPLVLLIPIAAAQNFQAPAGVKLTVSSPRTTYYLGEIIPLQLAFSSTQPDSFTADSHLYDRVGRDNYSEEYIVDPAASVEDPLQGLPSGGGSGGGISGGPVTLSQKPFTFERMLNEWVRFRKPGTYRLHVLSHRVGHLPPAARLDLVSNSVTLDIQSAPPAWISEQIANAVKSLDTPRVLTEADAKSRASAGRTLRFLNTPDAAIELARRLGAQRGVDSRDLIDTRYRALVIAVLEKRLIASSESVDDRFLYTLAELSQLEASGGPMPPFPKEEAAKKVWLVESKRRSDLQQSKWLDDVKRLIVALPSKQPQARAECLDTLLNSSGLTGFPSAWLPGIVSSLRADFKLLPIGNQQNLLEYRWPAIKSPEMLPVLREIYAHPPERRLDPPLKDSALRRIYELAPDEGRRLILDQIRKADRLITFRTLAMLPDRTLPEMNDVFAASLQSGRYDASLILRYATGSIVQQAEAAYLRRNEELGRQNLDQCCTPLVFYFLKYDPVFGERVLRQNLANPGGPPARYDIGFQFLSLGAWAMSPALERLAIEFLSSSSVPVKNGAAGVLGKYGSASAEAPLWHAMEFFHQWWKGREAQLKERQNEEGFQLERTLVIALAQGDAWVAGREKLQRLRLLCSSDRCRNEVTGWLRDVGSPIQISVDTMPEGFINVGQYHLRSTELPRKLSQYPAGTIFKIVPTVNVFSEVIESAIRAAGHTVTPQPQHRP